MESTNYYILNIISSECFRYSIIICEEIIETPLFSVQYKLYNCAGNIKKKVSLKTVIKFIKNKMPSRTIINQPRLIFTDSGDINYLILVVSNYCEDLTHTKYSPVRQVK